MVKTTIQVSVITWRKLNALKETPKESFDDVIKRLLPKEAEVVE